MGNSPQEIKGDIMSTPFIGEIKLWAFNWAPVDWAICDGSSLSINEHQALFSLIGTAFGGNGRTTFNLPDLRGRTAIGFGTSTYDGISYLLGAMGGLERVTLSEANMPEHTHDVRAQDADGTAPFPVDPTKNYYFSDNFEASSGNLYNANVSNPPIALSPNSLPTVAGSSHSHNNMQPSLVMNYCISLKGDYPSRN